MTWMFAYAELMGENLLRDYGAQPALLPGYHRSFNHTSTRLWGSEAHPCPILGLSPGGECWGLAFSVPWGHRRSMLRRLQPAERSEEYRRARLKVRLVSGEEEKAVLWVTGPQQAGSTRWSDIDRREDAFVNAHGTAGRGVEYVRTIAHALELWGLRDPLIDSVWDRLKSWRPR